MASIWTSRWPPSSATCRSCRPRPGHPTVRPRMGGTSVAVQADGTIVVAGWSDSHPTNFMLARLSASGALDPSFSGDGYVFTDFAGDADQADAVLIQPDGKIVAAGRAKVGGDYDFAVARYNPDGSLDTTFSGDGKATVGFGGDDAAMDIARQSDGKLV